MPLVIRVKCHPYRSPQVYRWEAASSGPAVFTALGSKDAALLPLSRIRFCCFPTPTGICSRPGLSVLVVASHNPEPTSTTTVSDSSTTATSTSFSASQISLITVIATFILLVLPTLLF
ncbi:hypothetical protein BKA82DRAFT_309796 [Pisolithus tinctorius]|uniref:Uncharacterized protein n=1 Tax=Pisolithus tinctorius Marx 270 TaxID=870435 RepID=A0A0C3P7C4_PISTI|nr:hypothetical protein BKA82DRAFT_309796 [Pisolithus tinctorius]KIO09295.1 hypothetical protein M404DRAFT_309796 [Pisolithus tinctorius Marx 270]